MTCERLRADSDHLGLVFETLSSLRLVIQNLKMSRARKEKRPSHRPAKSRIYRSPP